MPTQPAVTTLTPVLPSTTATLLVDWANEQDAWIRTVAKRVLETGIALADDELAALYEQFLIEKQLKAGTPIAVPPLIVPANEAGIGKPLQIVSLKDIAHVNALAAGQTIAFNPKLTVIFGENAAGKSGYVRILKRASNARTKEPILPNL
jgi:hypothetical protein